MKDIIGRQGVVCCLASVKNTLRNLTKIYKNHRKIMMFHLTYRWCTSLVIVALTTADHPKTAGLQLLPSSGHTQGCRAVPGTDLSSASILGRLKTYFLKYKSIQSVLCRLKKNAFLLWDALLKDLAVGFFGLQIEFPSEAANGVLTCFLIKPLAITRKSLIPVKPINQSIFQSCYCSRNTQKPRLQARTPCSTT